MVALLDCWRLAVLLLLLEDLEVVVRAMMSAFCHGGGFRLRSAGLVLYEVGCYEVSDAGTLSESGVFKRDVKTDLIVGLRYIEYTRFVGYRFEKTRRSSTPALEAKPSQAAESAPGLI